MTEVVGEHQIGFAGAIAPELHVPKTPAVPAWQAQPAHFTAHRRGGAVDPGVSAEPHDVAPGGPAFEPADQLGTGEAAIGQQHDRAEFCQKLISLLQQRDRDRSAVAGTGMLQRSPQHRDVLCRGPPPRGLPRNSGSRASWCRAPDTCAGLASASTAAPRGSVGRRAPLHQCGHC